MKIVRWILVIVLWTATGAVLYQCCYIPFACSLTEQQVQGTTLRIADLPAGANVRIAARKNLALLEPCIAAKSVTVNQLMVAAANYRILGRADEAIALYTRALQVDRRPELYLNLGLAQIEAGEAQSGIDNLVTACIFNPEFLNEVPVHQSEIKRRVDLYQELQERNKRGRPDR